MKANVQKLCNISRDSGVVSSIWKSMGRKRYCPVDGEEFKATGHYWNSQGRSIYITKTPKDRVQRSGSLE